MYKKTLDKNVRFFQSYGHMIVYYLLNFSGSTVYMALGISYKHFKDAENTAQWKQEMIKLINEAFPEPSMDKSAAINILDDYEKDISEI